jgi:hypothetical protein
MRRLRYTFRVQIPPTILHTPERVLFPFVNSSVGANTRFALESDSKSWVELLERWHDMDDMGKIPHTPDL